MNIVDLLIKHEGLRLKPYRDTVGKLTIGVGRNLDDMGITRGEALYLLGNDINRVRLELIKIVGWFLTLGTVRQTVLIDMVFNLGITRFKRFKKLIRAIEARDWEKAATEMLDSRWARQVGRRATELARMMRDGDDA